MYLSPLAISNNNLAFSTPTPTCASSRFDVPSTMNSRFLSPLGDEADFTREFLCDAAVKRFRAPGLAPDSSPEVIWGTLQALFGPTELAPVYRERFHARRQQPSESVDSFLRDLPELALKAYPELSPAERDCQICDRFHLGLSNQELRGKFLRKPASSLIQTVEKARAFEAVQESISDTPSVTELMCFVARNLPQPSSPANTTLDALHGAKWFPTLDLDSGYRQVKVRPADRQKKAFIIPSVLYGFETMPFDLANAPANFQRILQTVSQDLVPSQCLIYLDDITVHAPTIDEHNSRLKNVFERLRMAGLKLKPTKCVLLMQEVSFLGHLTTPAGVKTDGKKVKQIVDWPVPRSYRKFVQYFAETASPLYQPMEKGKKFVWSAECHAAFNTLEDKLSSPPILAFPDFSPSDGPFLLDTDASDLAIGAVLSQKPANGEVVIAYASRRLDKRKRRYCTTRR
ncbi:uncharacterized protein DEA37_0007654 [Paragonimus westermani]|uniref:Reverse transcriptase domain-containing protein n=1 Tax=Paragonimus westermani TaxID=34504 RepID=A0A5J4N576_9TREM|nr:uncharacterized protein DEA37_0007654 [Paragonimus westermani]